MKRFVLITAVGAAALLGGPGFLAVNLFPGHLSTFGILAQGCVALALGTAVFASGMLGLAESYEKTVSRLSHFLDNREHAAELAVRDEGDLATQHAAFWNGYQKTAAGTILFLAGILSLMIGLIDMSLSAYMAGVMTGIAVFGITAILLMFKGLRSIRRSHVAVASAAAVMALQPETRAVQFPSDPPYGAGPRQNAPCSPAGPDPVISSLAAIRNDAPTSEPTHPHLATHTCAPPPISVFCLRQRKSSPYI